MPTISSIRILDMIAQSTWDHITAQSLQLYEHGASISRLEVYAKKWSLWTQSGVMVETRWLTLKTTLIFQNICCCDISLRVMNATGRMID